MSTAASGTPAGDPSGMVAAFRGLPGQLVRSFDEARGLAFGAPPDLRSIGFCGMGGSAAAGDVVSAAYADRTRVPTFTWRRHGVPGHVDERSVVVCLSYSGNTEEALSAYAEARSRGATVLAVCAGGELAERAGRDGVPVALVPGDAPMPRAGLGYLVGAVLGALASARVLQEPERDVLDATRALDALSTELDPAGLDNDAAEIAAFVGSAVPVVWGAGAVGDTAAWRWKCAFNENAKLPAFSSSLPELNHHEVVGWAGGTGEGFRLVILRHPGEHPSIDEQLRATLEEIGAAGLASREVRARGETALAHVLSLIMIGDLGSTLDALSRGVDPAPIEAIRRVKARLHGSGRP